MRESNFLIRGIAALAFSMLLASAGPAFAQCASTLDGIVAWWPLDHEPDDIIGGHNGTPFGTLSFQPAVVNQGISITDTASTFWVANDPALNPTKAISVEAWYLPSSFAGSGNDPIVDKPYYGHSPPYYQYHLGVTGDQYGASPASFGFTVTVNGSPNTAYTTNHVWTPGNWYHIVGTYDGAHLRIFVNGALHGEVAVTGSISQYSTALYVGRFGNLNFHLPGVLDEVAIYNRALSPGEVTAIYNAGSAGKCRTPVLVQSPASKVDYLSHNLTLAASAIPISPVVGFQWFTNGTAIPGATNQILTLTNLQYSDGAIYTLVASNSFGSVTSAPPAVLTVKPYGASIARYPGNIPGVTIEGILGNTYGIQASTNLENTNGWTGLTNLTLGTFSTIWYDSLPAAAPQRFYRVLPGPIPVP